MTNDLITNLLDHGPVICDGAWGTQLQEQGLAQGECPELWNVTHPDAVSAVARAYTEAGSQVVLTNTFGGNRYALRSHGHHGRVAELNQRGVELSREGVAAVPGTMVFASIGPTGKLLVAGDVEPSDLRKAFQQQALAVAQGGADAIVIETMSDLQEAEIAVHACLATGLPVIACMSFSSGKSRDRTIMGVTPEAAAEKLLAAGASLVGANCGNGAEEYLPVCKRLRAASGRPVWMKPNAGVPIVVDGAVTYRTSPDAFAGAAIRLVESGAAFIGGCCGTNPQFIKTLVSRLRPMHTDRK